MPKVAGLYLKTDQGILGPILAPHLRSMARIGRISQVTPVSADGKRWLSAGKVRGLFSATQASAAAADKRSHAIAVPLPATQPETQEIFLRLEKCMRWLPLAFHSAVSGSVLGVLFGVFALLYLGFSLIVPGATHLVLAAVAIVPAALVAAASGQSVGNLVLRTLTRTTDRDRRMLAIHLPWNRAPQAWPRYLRNWIYGRDWFLDRHEGECVAYIRAFVTGSRPPTWDEELGLWEDLLRPTSGGNDLAEVGPCVWEMSWMASLPEWAREIGEGATLTDLERRLGAAGRKWTLCLLHRAASRLPEFIPADFSSDLRRIGFEFHHAPLRNRREGLLVILRPRTSPAPAPQIESTAEAAA